MNKDWKATERYKPPQGIVVETMNSGGNVQNLIFKDNLWWFSDMSMYVYYVPIFWREEEI